MENESIIDISKPSPYDIDLPVLINFWRRPEVFRTTLLSVIASKPSEIYLYQNAESPNFTDLDHRKYEECANIAKECIANIDYACRVIIWKPKDYCDLWFSVYRAVKWAFSRSHGLCACLDDDCAPAKTWLRFCKTLLDKYSATSKIGYVYCEVNCEKIKPAFRRWDYVFSTTGSIHGWASYKKVFDGWDEKYTWLDDPAKISKIARFYGKKKTKYIIKTAQQFRKINKPEIEIYMGIYQALNDLANITPTKNMLIYNGRVGEHSGSGDYLSRKMERYFNKKSFDVCFPLRGPANVSISKKTDRKIDSAIRNNFFDWLTVFWRYLVHGQAGLFFKKVFSHLF